MSGRRARASVSFATASWDEGASYIDAARERRMVNRIVDRKPGGRLRFASIPVPSVRVIGCTTASAKVVEVDGKRYRAHPYSDDGVPCVAWDSSDEIKDGQR